MMSRKFGWIVTCAAVTTIAACALFACGGGSCLDEYPCNAGDDDDNLSDGSFDGTTHVTLDAAADAIDDMSTIDDAPIDAQPDGSDASDD
jgi:hypothetical protein